MPLHHAFIRGTYAAELPLAEFGAIAHALCEQPVECLLTAQGLRRGRELVQGTGRSSALLARRNIRTLLARRPDAEEVARALQIALAAAPHRAQDALEDAELELNLRLDLFACLDAGVSIIDSSLRITDDGLPQVCIPRAEFRSRGSQYLSLRALARLLALEVQEVQLSPTAIWPVSMQVEPGAVMEPDSAHQHLRKGDWRGVRRTDFVKEYCVVCGRCFTHCPDNAIIHARHNAAAPETSGVLGIDQERCTGCGICATVCPTNGGGYKAIVMVESGVEAGPELHCVG